MFHWGIIQNRDLREELYMHEYAVAKGIINTCINEAKNSGASRIIEIRLVIGELSTIIDESVQMYFDVMSEDTIAKGAKLVFSWVKAELQCRECMTKFDKPKNGFECPICDGQGALTGVGKEFYIESIEID